MAIALYSTTNIPLNSSTVDGGTGANRCIMFVACADTTNNMTAVTWNGESLTKGLTQLSANTRYNYIWYLFNPTGTGSQTLAITGPADRATQTCLVYTGVSGIPTNFIQNSNTASTSISNSHTASNGDWLVGGANNNVASMSVGSNTTLRSGSSSAIEADSNGVASPTALNYTWIGSGSGDAYGCVISPSVASTTNSKFFALL